MRRGVGERRRIERRDYRCGVVGDRGGTDLPGCGCPVWSYPASRPGSLPAVLCGAPGSGRRRGGVTFPRPRRVGTRTASGRRHSRAASPLSPIVSAPRRRADGSTYYRQANGSTCRRRAGASTYQLVYLAIGDASSMISTSSRESFSKARHMATSSQESQGPCSSPVASSTTV